MEVGSGDRRGAGEVPSRPDLLLVDDDPDIRDSLRELLEGEGYRVETARHGAAALAAALRAAPSLILLDLHMPVMDGAEFRRRQLAEPALAHIPTYVVSAAGGVEGRVAALAVNGHLEKPLDIEALLAVVARHCAR